ncbi:alpha,alpha-trehalase TreA [Celerinatantimonas diazotrophica]|uniref:Putative periplasmic trehalase n=1 Tax=Celerinatantimonas diazotrophica TaxID=412034 RepID=A0A4R1K1E1_9GAMM|nr:alpha,alpha-trehalase TreA [Celerinatantimonas diazotrophica]TCK57785.1 alpha,alpha-trehalase [Celerinatantimonas diazotrophica]CAG9298151.1 Periplasmic trehalase [Celerinatantimonas diazotrophica]
MVKLSHSSRVFWQGWRNVVSVAILALLLVCQSSIARQSVPQSPDILFGPLFDAVQRAQLFSDQKTFADAVAKRSPKLIVADWQKEKSQQGFDLKKFVLANFTLPATHSAYVPPANQSLRAHIDGLWSELTRSAKKAGKYDSLLPIPKPYVVPGGRFREVYYWDSYFTMLGLAESGHWPLIKDMLDNFAWELDQYGLIPNGNRSYYLSRSQPPFFSLMVSLYAQHQGDQVYVHYLGQLQKEYDYWMAGSAHLAKGKAINRVVRLANGTLLNRYWDARDVPRPESWLADIKTASNVPAKDKPALYRQLRSGAASGWDYSSRWFRDYRHLSTIEVTHIIPVDLNSLLYHLEQVLAKGYQLKGDPQLAAHYRQLAAARAKAINTYLYNKTQGWYCDYDWTTGHVREQLTAAALFPLFLNIATDKQANATAKAVLLQLVHTGGLATTTVETGQQWDAPNGWAPLQWVAVVGLNNYHHPALAKRIAMGFLKNVQATYDSEHKLVEKYVVQGRTLGGGGGGEYPLQDGFGWTNGVTIMLLDKYCPAHKVCQSVHDLPPVAAGD